MNSQIGRQIERNRDDRQVRQKQQIRKIRYITQIGSQTDRQGDRQVAGGVSQLVRQMHGWTDKKLDWVRLSEIRKIDRQKDRRKDRQIGRQADRQTDRKTDALDRQIDPIRLDQSRLDQIR